MYPKPLAAQFSFASDPGNDRVAQLVTGLFKLMEQSQKSLTMEEISSLREQTEAISQLLQQRIRGYLETLRPLFAPSRLLGNYVGAREDVVGAPRVFKQLQELYQKISGQPFSLHGEIEKEHLSFVENQLELFPWQYAHEAKSGGENRLVTITTPVRWVLTYRSAWSMSQLLQVLEGKTERRQENIRQFVINALIMNLVLAKYPNLKDLLADLRFRITTEKLPVLGDLPLTTINACLPSFRPADEIVLATTRFSGVPSFVELIDGDAVRTLGDPLNDKLKAILK
jgi:hypothetical protein